jgi:hypothetical protein
MQAGEQSANIHCGNNETQSAAKADHCAVLSCGPDSSTKHPSVNILLAGANAILLNNKK